MEHESETWKNAYCLTIKIPRNCMDYDNFFMMAKHLKHLKILKMSNINVEKKKNM